MSYTVFAADVLAKLAAGVEVRYAVEVVGIPYVFTSGPINATAFAALWPGRSQLLCLKNETVKSGEERIDLMQRRVTSGSGAFSLLEDTGGILRGLISPCAEPIARVNAYSTAVDTTINVTRPSRTVSSTPLYIGAETIIATAWSAGVITATRGAFGSVKQELFGRASGIGASIYGAPMSWTNRQVKIWAYCLTDKKTSPTASAWYGTIYSGRIVDKPKSTQGLWSFDLEHDAERIASTECGMGLPDKVAFDRELQEEDHNDQFVFSGAAAAYADPISDDSCLMIEASHGKYLAKVTASSSGVMTAENHFGYIVRDHNVPDRLGLSILEFQRPLYSTNALSARHVVRVRGDASEVMLKLIASNTGDGTWGSWDLLPGKLQTSFGGPAFRFGAGLGAYLDDEFDFTQFAGRARMDITIDKPIKFGDLLQCFCIAVDAFWYVNQFGYIKFGSLAGKVTGSASAVKAITQDDIIGSPSSWFEQGPGLHSVTMRASKDPLVDEYLAETTSTDAEVMSIFGQDVTAYEIDLPWISVDGELNGAKLVGALKHDDGMHLSTMRTLCRRIQRESMRGRMFIEFQTSMEFGALKIDELVTVTDNRINIGNGQVANGTRCKVVGREFSWESGKVKFLLCVAKKQWHFTPSSQITGYNAGTKTLTISSTFDSQSPAAPSLYPNNAEIALYNASTDTVEIGLVASTTATTVVLQATPSSWTYTANKSFLWLSYSPNPTINGLTIDDMAFHVTPTAYPGGDYYSEWT